MAKQDNDYRNSGFINVNWNDNDRCWQVGGTFTDKDGKKWDLGFHKVGSGTDINECAEMCARQIGASIHGKGIPYKERNKNGGGNPGGY